MSHGSARHSLLAAGRDAHIIERGCNRLWLIDEWRQCCQWTPVGWPVHRHRHLNPSHPMNNCAYMTQEQRDPHLAVHTVTHWSDEILACPSLTPPPRRSHPQSTSLSPHKLARTCRCCCGQPQPRQGLRNRLSRCCCCSHFCRAVGHHSLAAPTVCQHPGQSPPNPAPGRSMQSAAHPPQLTAAGP